MMRTMPGIDAATDRRQPLAQWRFPVLLALVLAFMVARINPLYYGDVVEYMVNTVAIADHGTPDIRTGDVARMRTLLPGLFVEPYDQLERGLRNPAEPLLTGFVRGREGDVFAIHFFGYPLLAAAPFKLFESLGILPFKAFVAVHAAALFVLGLALRRFFRSELKAWAGLLLFMLCGGVLYLRWINPEFVTASLLLAGLLFFTSGAPVAGSVLAGIAAQQNPTIMFFFGFAPLFKLALDYDRGRSVGANLRALFSRRTLAGLAAGIAVFALPPLFNLWQFGVPNIIAKLFSDASLVSGTRLLSFYFDLNQGMIVGIPGLALALLLLLWLWRRDPGQDRRAGVALAALLFTLALALPTMAVLNWNSGAAGVMRYAFWASMAFLFALLAMLRGLARWPRVLVGGMAALQLAAMAHADSYSYIDFSPAARLVLARAPHLYHPEPEIFGERATRQDNNTIRKDQVYTLANGEATVKTLVNDANPQRDAQLCGAGKALAPGLPQVPSTDGWRYIDGPLRCVAAPRPAF